MAKIMPNLKDVKTDDEEITISQQYTRMGMHWTFWGAGRCFHIYEDETANLLTTKELLEIGKILEKEAKRAKKVRVNKP